MSNFFNTHTNSDKEYINKNKYICIYKNAEFPPTETLQLSGKTLTIQKRIKTQTKYFLGKLQHKEY